MKQLLSIACLAAISFALFGCGEQYTPLTDEEVSQKAEEMFEEKKEEMINQFDQRCTEMMDSLVEAKVTQLNQ